jgi:signal recognition particle GTPase
MKRMSLMEQAIKMPNALDSASHGKKSKFKAKSNKFEAKSLSQMYNKFGKKGKMKSLAQMASGYSLKARSKKKFKSVWM